MISPGTQNIFVTLAAQAASLNSIAQAADYSSKISIEVEKAYQELCEIAEAVTKGIVEWKKFEATVNAIEILSNNIHKAKANNPLISDDLVAHVDQLKQNAVNTLVELKQALEIL